MKVVHRKDAKALKGDRSLSYQVISPDNVGSRKFLVTVVDIRPGGSTPVHEHRTVESMYYILEGRGEVTSGREHKVLGPDTAVYFPAGSTHGIRNVGKARLRYLFCHAPPYEIEDLYRSWQGHESLVMTGGCAVLGRTSEEAQWAFHSNIIFAQTCPGPAGSVSAR